MKYQAAEKKFRHNDSHSKTAENRYCTVTAGMNYLEIEKVIGREILDSRGNPTVEAEVTLADGTVGRGTAPSGASTGEFEALELRDGDKGRYLGKGVQKAGYEPGRDFKIAMDAASSEWKSEKGKGYYKLPKAGTEYTDEELIEHWASLCEKYPIISIEDGLDEEDWEGWQKLTKRLGDKVQLVGDDLFVTNTERLSKGISLGAGNAILIKLNQIGSVSKRSRWHMKQAMRQSAPTVPAKQQIRRLLTLLWH